MGGGTISTENKVMAELRGSQLAKKQPVSWVATIPTQYAELRLYQTLSTAFYIH